MTKKKPTTKKPRRFGDDKSTQEPAPEVPAKVKEDQHQAIAQRVAECRRELAKLLKHFDCEILSTVQTEPFNGKALVSASWSIVAGEYLRR